MAARLPSVAWVEEGERLAALRAFMAEHVYPREAELAADLDREVGPGRAYPESFVELRALARERGLWNLFLDDPRHGPALGQAAYAPLCEEMGRSHVAPPIFNCAPPDSGNIETLLEHGDEAQLERWLEPLLHGDARSCFAMTEPGAAGSDPTTLQTRARQEGEEFVIDGAKWFTTGALGAELILVMCVTDPEADRHRRASILLVAAGTPGVELVRNVPVMGHAAGPGHGELRFAGCRVPASALLGERGRGFEAAQGRLGPGRLHHAMRAIGMAERALELLCERAVERHAFGETLADKQLVQDFVARSRIEIDQTRLLVLAAAAEQLDAVGAAAARDAVAMAKVAAAQMQQRVLDRAIQVHGALGLTDDTPLAAIWRFGRGLRILDGPDEVHKWTIARSELRRARERTAAAGEAAR